MYRGGEGEMNRGGRERCIEGGRKRWVEGGRERWIGGGETDRGGGGRDGEREKRRWMYSWRKEEEFVLSMGLGLSKHTYPGGKKEEAN